MNTTPKLKGLNTGKFDEDWVGIGGAGTVAEVGIPTSATVPAPSIPTQSSSNFPVFSPLSLGVVFIDMLYLLSG